MGMGLCVAFIAFVRLPSLKVSTLLLTGLLLYDVFWVFFSSYIFSANVMVKVATRPADNPVGLVARKLNLGAYVREPPKLNLPGKLVFPSIHNSGHFSMLGLGDIVMPGLLLCFVLRYDAYKKSQGTLADVGVPVPKGVGSRLTYFHCSLLGWVRWCNWSFNDYDNSDSTSFLDIFLVFWLPLSVRKFSKQLNQLFCTWYHLHYYRCLQWLIWR